MIKKLSHILPLILAAAVLTVPTAHGSYYGADEVYLSHNGLEMISFIGGADGFSYYETVDGHVNLMNDTEGYNVTLPMGAVVDTGLSPLRTTVSYGSVKLHIYTQDCLTVTPDEYINYSNTFLSTDCDIGIWDQGVTTVDGHDAVYAVWSRRPLSEVPDDLPNYACYDIKYDGSDELCRVITLMFKFAEGVNLEEEITPIVESFHAVDAFVLPESIRVGEGAGPALNNVASEAYKRIFAPDAGLTWGAYLSMVSEIPEVEEQVDYKFDIYLLYSGFNVNRYGEPMILGERLYDLLDRVCPPGKIPELTLQTYMKGKEGLMIYDVLNGEYEKFLRAYADDVARFGRPVLMRPGNEMNGDWCPYSAFVTCRDPDIYIEFYRYIFNIFAEQGADNAIWVFNPNNRSFPDFKWNHELMYYPGDPYVNVVGMTAYNTGTYYDFESWNTFDELYDELYTTYVRRYAKPLMITEFACSGIGGDKPAWINDMFASLPNYPMIKAAVWWSGYDLDKTDPDRLVISRPYMMNENEDTAAAFREGLAAYK